MRFSVIYILVVFTLTAVSCQHQVISSFTGGNVLLPCVYERRDSSSNKVNVFWRDKYDDHVLDIIQNEADRQFQHQNFIDRVEGFPDQYKKGNFSIILKDLRQSDSGVYECFVEDVKQSVQLTVSGEPLSLFPDVPVGPPNNSSMENDDNQHIHLLIRQYKFTMYGSFVLNFLLVTATQPLRNQLW
ncbi:hypothetical protein Q8A73_004010 [Channa argus]|nr:hypothetical protein Q8A73_004010 [Channa argus]